MLGEQQVDSYRENGFLRIAGVFSSDEVTRLRNDLDWMIGAWAVVGMGWSGPWRRQLMDSETETRSKLIAMHDLHFYAECWMRAVTSPAVAEKWRTTPKDSGSGQFVLPDSGQIFGAQFHSTSLLGIGEFQDRVIFGFWSQCVLAEWSSLDLVVDGISAARSGLVKITALAHVDVAFRHPEAFAVSTDSAAQ